MNNPIGAPLAHQVSSVLLQVLTATLLTYDMDPLYPATISGSRSPNHPAISPPHALTSSPSARPRLHWHSGVFM